MAFGANYSDKPTFGKGWDCEKKFQQPARAERSADGMNADSVIRIQRYAAIRHCVLQQTRSSVAEGEKN